MAINRYVNRQPFQVNFYTPPLEVMANALQMKQAAYDKYFALADELSQQQISALSPDRARANALIQGYQKSIDDVVQQYEGDYSRIGKDLQSVARRIRKDFSPGGEAYAIQSNYQLYQDWLKRHQDLVKSKVIRPEQLNLGSSYILGNYEGIGEINPLTKTYNTINTLEIVPYVDIGKKAMEAAKEVVAEKGGYESWTLSNGYIWGKKGGKWERVTPERIERVVLNSIGTSPEIAAYVQQSRLFGYDPLSEETLQGILQQAVDTYAYDNRWSTKDLKFDPLGVKQIEDEMDMRQSMRYMPTAKPGMTSQPMRRRDLPLKDESTGYAPTQLGPGYSKEVGEYRDDLGGLETNNTRFRSSNLADIVNTDVFKNKYGQFGVDLYNNLEKAGRFNGLSETQKRDVLIDEYNRTLEQFHRQPLVYNFGKKTMEKETYRIGRSLSTLTFDYIEPDGTVHEGIPYKELVRLSKGKIFNPSESTMNEFQESVIKGEGAGITGITQSASGVSTGYVLEGPNLGGGYAIVRGVDAEWSNASKPILELSKAAQTPEPVVTDWVVFPNTNMEVRAVGKPVFDNKGSFAGKQTEFYIRPIGEKGEGILEPNLTLEQLQQYLSETEGMINIPHKAVNNITF